MIFERTIESLAHEVATTFRAMVVCGPRQVGKTWLLRRLTSRLGGYGQVSFDNDSLCAQAKEDPLLFLQVHPSPLYLDEIQRVPELFPALKEHLDGNVARGQYLMTGSQQFKVMKNARESLAGRVGILRLQGLSKAETEGRISPNPFVPSLNPEQWRNLSNWGIRDVYAAIVRGGYPECHSIPSLRVRHYFASYIDTYIERDIREMIDITNIGTFRTFMRVCAARTGQLLNYADLARDVGISTPTARAWLSMLETSGVIYLLHPYYNNLIKRAVKTPKLYFTDTGLCSHLLGITSAEAAIDSPLSGELLETFVLMDIFKSHWYAGSDAQFWFFRDGDQHEVDLILDYEGRLHPIEIKRAASIRPSDIRPGFSAFHAAVGNRAATGSVVLIGDSFGALDAETALIPVGAL